MRLDRALVNLDWKLKFPKASVSNLPKSYSNYCPMLILPKGNLTSNRSPSKPPFRFLEAWFYHPNFNDIFKNTWTVNTSLHSNLTSFGEGAMKWNKEVFGNIFYKKNKIKDRLKGIQMAQE